MTTIYKEYKVNLSSGQINKLLRSIIEKKEITLRLSNNQLKNGNHPLNLTRRQFLRIGKALKNGVGVEIRITRTQLRKVMKKTGKGLQVIPQGKGLQVIPQGKGMQVEYPYQPPPFIGDWRKKKR